MGKHSRRRKDTQIMLPSIEREVRAFIAQAIRPLQRRIDRLEKELRKLKSDLQQTKNTVNRIKK